MDDFCPLHWECAPCKSVFESYPTNEMMTIISGSVTLTCLNDGRPETYVAGESLFVAKGMRCIWENLETVRKFYFIASVRSAAHQLTDGGDRGAKSK